MNQPRAALLALLSGVLVVVAASPLVHAQATVTPHIAVVNLKQVYTTIQETVDSQNQLKGLQGELETMQKSHQLDLQGMQQKMTNSVKVDSPAHESMMADFDEKSLQYSLEEKKMQVRMVREQGRQLTQAFAEIQAEVATLAKQRGLDLVLVNSNAELPSNAQDIANPETLGNLVFNRSILFTSDKVDITADVVTALDAAYKSKASGGK